MYLFIQVVAILLFDGNVMYLFIQDRIMKPLGGYLGYSSEWRDLAQTISRVSNASRSRDTKTNYFSKITMRIFLHNCFAQYFLWPLFSNPFLFVKLNFPLSIFKQILTEKKQVQLFFVLFFFFCSLMSYRISTCKIRM